MALKELKMIRDIGKEVNELKLRKKVLSNIIKHAQEEISELDNKLRALREKLDVKARLGVSKVLVDISSGGRHFDPLEKGMETIRFMLAPENMQDRELSLELFGKVSGEWEEKISVTYFRISNVLLHTHGGVLFLKDYQTCDDSEWDLLKSGNIPEKFIR